MGEPMKPSSDNHGSVTIGEVLGNRIMQLLKERGELLEKVSMLTIELAGVRAERDHLRNALNGTLFGDDK